MTPRFWKVSHGTEEFSHQERLTLLQRGIICVHHGTHPKGRSTNAQGDDFVNADIGDYFYLTHGNEGVYVLGQLTGPADIFSTKQGGWIERPYRTILASLLAGQYSGTKKWWTPNHNSTFTVVPDKELQQFERLILYPYFGVKLSMYGI